LTKSAPRRDSVSTIRLASSGVLATIEIGE
jgi:hypothetical protein